jgi:uncharacterized protein YbaP (TraB family)
MALKWRGFRRLFWAAPLLLAGAQPAVAKEAPAAAKSVESKGPEASRRVPKPVAQEYEPRPAVWLLSDEDTKIYLFGTNHILPPGFKWRSPAVESAVKAADALVVETYTTPEEEAALEAEVLPLMFLAEPKPFVKRFPKKHRAQIREDIRQAGIPAESLDTMQTWAGGMMIGLASVFEDYGADDPDAKLTAEVPTESEAEAEEASERELHDWAQGRPEQLTETIEDLPAEMYDVLVTRRNAAWTEWLAKRLDAPGTLFVAVGAGHLAGKDSVQSMLAKRGLEAKRVD